MPAVVPLQNCLHCLLVLTYSVEEAVRYLSQLGIYCQGGLHARVDHLRTLRLPSLAARGCRDDRKVWTAEYGKPLVSEGLPRPQAGQVVV